jgi:hypothetical protein
VGMGFGVLCFSLLRAVVAKEGSSGRRRYGTRECRVAQIGCCLSSRCWPVYAWGSVLLGTGFGLFPLCCDFAFSFAMSSGAYPLLLFLAWDFCSGWLGLAKGVLGLPSGFHLADMSGILIVIVIAP